MTAPPKRRGRVYLDDVDHLLAFGCSLDEIAKRLDVEVLSIKQALRRRAKRSAGHAQPAARQAPAA